MAYGDVSSFGGLMQAELVRSVPNVETGILSAVLNSSPGFMAAHYRLTAIQARAVQVYVLCTLVLRYRCMVSFEPVGNLPKVISQNYKQIPPAFRAVVRDWLREE